MILDKNDALDRKVMKVLVETDPHIDIVEDIDMYLKGMTPTLSEFTVKFLEKNPNMISNLREQIRIAEEED